MQTADPKDSNSRQQTQESPDDNATRNLPVKGMQQQNSRFVTGVCTDTLQLQV